MTRCQLLGERGSKVRIKEETLFTGVEEHKTFSILIQVEVLTKGMLGKFHGMRIFKVIV